MTPSNPYAPRILDLLLQSPFGLSPAEILQVGVEAGWVIGTNKAAYLRVRRALRGLQSRGLLLRSGHRYLLPMERLKWGYLLEANVSVREAIDMSFLPPNLEAWKKAFFEAIETALGRPA